MADKVAGIILGDDDALAAEIKDALSDTVDIQTVIPDVRGAYGEIKEQAPGMVFLDVRRDVEGVFALSGRIDRLLPNVIKFIVSDAGDSALIVRCLRAGADDFIEIPLDRTALSESVAAALEKRSGREREGNIIVVSSNKGGQGVTTIAVNLAAHIRALSGTRVLLADLRLQAGDVALLLDMESKYTAPDLIKDMPRLDENLLLSSLPKHAGGFYVLTAPEEIGVAETGVTENFGRMLRMLKEYMDYIVVDISHEFNEQTASVIDLAEKVLLVSQQTIPALRSVRKALELFRSVGYEDDKVKIVVNRYEAGNDLRCEEMEKIFEQGVYATVANDYHAVTEAINHGRLLSENHEDTPVNRDIGVLASLITGVQQETPAGRDSGLLTSAVNILRNPMAAWRKQGI